MLCMLSIDGCLTILPDEKIGTGSRVGDGSSRSSPGPSVSGSIGEKKAQLCDVFGVTGEGVAVVVAEVGVSCRYASSNSWSSAVAVGERNKGRLILL